MALPWFLNVYHIIIPYLGVAKHHGFCQFTVLASFESDPTLHESGPTTHWKTCFQSHTGHPASMVVSLVRFSSPNFLLQGQHPMGPQMKAAKDWGSLSSRCSSCFQIHAQLPPFRLRDSSLEGPPTSRRRDRNASGSTEVKRDETSHVIEAIGSARLAGFNIFQKIL